MDDDTVSVQSQETDKPPDTPSSSISKSSNGSKESTPIPTDDDKKLAKDTGSKEGSVEKEQPDNDKEKKVNCY